MIYVIEYMQIDECDIELYDRDGLINSESEIMIMFIII